MDAETRHQLKQNELAEAIGKLVDFSDKRTLAWLGVILVVALLYAGHKYVGWRSDIKQQQNAQALTQINARDPEMGDAPLASLRDLISQASQPGLIAMARLKLAEGLEARGQGPDGVAMLSEAEQEYQKIVNMKGVADADKAPAIYRLGILNETKRDFARAGELYEQLANEERFAGSPFAMQAANRLELLPDLERQVVFVPGAKPLEAIPDASEEEMHSILNTESEPEVSDKPAFELPYGSELPVAEQPQPPAEEPAEEPAQEEPEPEQP